MNLPLNLLERRISAYQLRTIDSVEDESSSSGREDGAPDSPHQFPHQQQPGEYGQYLGVNGQVQHQGRSRTKKPKVRSKSLQPPTNVVPWRKSSRPHRGRSLDKQPFLPGFKPEPVKSWTEETISLKATPIEKKKPTPKLEAAQVVLKSIKTERDQGIMSLGATLEQIIAGKTEKEAVPWITMREKLKQVESVQQQLSKFDLDEVYLRPLEGQIETDQQLPQQAQVEQVQRTQEIQRLKSMESVEIMEMTDQIDKLITQQQNNKDLIPWKEMRQQLKSVQRVTKEIDKFKIEEVELRHLQAQQAISEEFQSTAEDTVVMTIDDSSKSSISKVMHRDQVQHYEDQSNIYKQQYITSEDVNIMHVSERERLEAQKLIREQQAVNWRQSQQRPQLQPLTSVEDTVSQTSDRQKILHQQSLIEEAQRQQYVQIEDSQMMSLEQYEHQKTINQRTQHEAYNWRQPQEPQKFVQVEDSSLLHLQERQDTQEQRLLQQQPVMWDRGTKKPEKPRPQPESPVQPQPVEEKPKTYEEMHDELVEPVSVQQPQPTPVLWERGKKKPVESKQKTFEELHDVLDEPVAPQQPELVPVLWERGKKKPITQETITTQEIVQSSRVVQQQSIEQQEVEQLSVEETKKATVRRVIPPREPEEKVEQVQLKPTPRQRPKEAQKVEDFQLKPLKSIRSIQKTVQETVQQAYEEETDALIKEGKLQQPETVETPKTLEIAEDTLEEEVAKPEEPQPQAVLWQRGKKKPQQVTPEDIPKSLEVAVDTLDEETIPTTQLEPQPVLWERGKKKKPQPEQIIEQQVEDVPTKTYEEAVDVLPDQVKIEEQPQPVLWQRGKKKTPQPTPTDEEHLDEVDAQKVVQAEKEIAEKRKVKRVKKPKSIREQPQEQEEASEEEVPVDQPVEETPEQEIQEKQEEIVEEQEEVEEVKRVKKVKKPKKPAEVAESIEQPVEEISEYEEQEEIVEEQEETEEVKKVKKTKKPKKQVEVTEEVEQPIEEDTQPEETVEEQKEIVEEKRKVKKTKKSKAIDTEQVVEEEPQPEHVEEEEQATIVEPKKKPIVKTQEEVEQVEKVTLKSVPRKQRELPVKEQIEEVTLKPRPRTSIVSDTKQPEETVTEHVEKEKVVTFEDQIVDVTKKRVKKKKPKTKPESQDSIEEPIEEVEVQEDAIQPEEVVSPESPAEEEVLEVETPKETVQKPKPKKQEVVEMVEEVSLKPVVRPKKQLPQEAIIEEVHLKPTKRIITKPEEVKLEEIDLQHVEKVEEEIVQEEKRKVKKVKKPKHEDLPEISDAEPTVLEEVEHMDIEKEPKPEEEQPQVPWKRGQKKEPVSEPIEEKQWPTGKRRPAPEEQPEEVHLKPIPSKSLELPTKPEKAIPGPHLQPEEKVESEDEISDLEPPKIVDDKQPKEKAKKEKKKKPKLRKATPSVDEVSEEVAEPFAEPIAEEDQVEELPVDDIKVVAVSEDVQPEEEVVITEKTPEAKQKAHKKRTKPLKQASVEGQPQLLESAVAEIEKADEISQEISQKTITLLKKTEDTRPQFITTEQLIELDVEDVRRDLEMKLTSNIIKKEKRRVVLDDSQPLPELELITQKRIQEGIDKVADEELIEDQQLKQNLEETTTSEVIGQERKLVKKKKKEIKPPRITEKLRPRQCVPEEPTVLECKVDGVPFPEINWYFNDMLLFASEKYEINVVEQVAQLKIAKVTPSDVGVYTCEAKNEAGVATSRTNIILGEFDYYLFFIFTVSHSESPICLTN